MRHRVDRRLGLRLHGPDLGVWVYRTCTKNYMLEHVHGGLRHEQ